VKPRVLVCTPIYGAIDSGSVSLGYLNSCADINTLASFLPWRAFTNCDLVRARSRAVRMALDACATHLLFWDADVVGSVGIALAGMLQQDRDVIAAAYPRKHWPIDPVHQGEYLPMGFALIKARVLEQMWDAYYDELFFDDVIEMQPVRTVALFQLVFIDRELPRPHRVLLSEDFSFCHRWLALGGELHLYDGPGSPLGHVGSIVYRGTREELLRENLQLKA
jgi:hypothetical protein